MEEMADINKRYDVNEIIARDLFLGDLAREAEACYDNSLYTAANACLFLLIEHAIKHGVGEVDGNFSGLLLKAKKNGIISEQELKILDSVRERRNKMFHECNYMYFEDINGIKYQLSEPDTKKIIYEAFSGQCFSIVKNILSTGSY